MGRLIDADVLKKDLTRFYDGEVVARKLIDEQPTVDAVPVVHGEWTDKDGGIATCSVCGDRWGVWSVMKYCPNCGARMDWKDGEAND